MQKLLATLAAWLMLGVSYSAYAETEREAIIKTLEKLTSSVGALYGVEEGGDMKFLCSATAVDKLADHTVVLTANHCLRQGVAYLINFGDNQLRPLTVWKIPHYEVDVKKFPRRYNEPKTDMALFLMPGTDVPLVPLADESRLPVGSRVLMVGFPLGVAKISYEGTLAGYLARKGSDWNGYLLLQIFGAPGSSGSALIDAKTERVVGVLVGAVSGFTGLPVIFGSPVEYMKNLEPVLSDNKKN